MSYVYTFDSDAHSALCLATEGDHITRQIRMLFYPVAPQDGFGLLGICPRLSDAVVIAHPELCARTIAERLRFIIAEIGRNGICNESFLPQGDAATASPRFIVDEEKNNTLNFIKDGENNDQMLVITGDRAYDVAMYHKVIYSGGCHSNYIQCQAIPVSQEVTVAFGRNASGRRLIRRLRRYVRHIEEFGLHASFGREMLEDQKAIRSI